MTKNVYGCLDIGDGSTYPLVHLTPLVNLSRPFSFLKGQRHGIGGAISNVRWTAVTFLSAQWDILNMFLFVSLFILCVCFPEVLYKVENRLHIIHILLAM